MIAPDIQPWDYYVSPTTGQPITSYKQRREDMARSNCVDYEPSLLEERDRKLRNDELRLDKAVDATVEEAIEKMPNRKRERLANELESGADIEISRQ